MSPPAPGKLGGVVDWKILGWYWLRGFLCSGAVKMACTSLRVGIEICVYLVLHRGREEDKSVFDNSFWVLLRTNA